MSEGCCIVELDGAVGSDLVLFRVVDVNPAICECFGGGHMVGRPVYEVLPGDSVKWCDLCMKALEAEHPLKAEQVHHNGRSFEISAVKISGQASERVAILFTDITERKLADRVRRETLRIRERLSRLRTNLKVARVKHEASEAVRITQERFRAFLDQNGAGTFIKDEAGRYLFVNQTLELRFGRKSEEWIGKTDFDLFPASDAARNRDNELTVLASRKACQFTESAIELDGQHEYLSFKFPIRDQAGAWFIGGTSFDITKQKHAEKMLADNQERLRALAVELTRVEHQERRRIASILHEDVQQLLIAMQMRVSIVRHKSVDAAVQQHIDSLSELLSQSIDAVRSLSRDLIPPVLYHLGLVAGLEWLAERFEQRHGLKVKVCAGDATDPRSDMLRDVLFHITRELLFNVVKHARTDWAEIRLTRMSRSLQLIVRDRGVGLDPGQCWQRIDTFGLFQIRERLLSMGGMLILRNHPGNGVEAEVTIPCEPIEGD